MYYSELKDLGRSGEIIQDISNKLDQNTFLINRISHDVKDINDKVIFLGSQNTNGQIQMLTSEIVNLKTKVFKLESFIDKILPIFPDEIKLYLELGEDEGEH